MRLRIIADQINQLRLNLEHSSFLQVTATPYALYLQPEDSPLVDGADYAPVRPSFTVSIPDHAKYIGGKFYFEDSKTAGDVASYVFNPVTGEELNALRKEDGRVVKLDKILECAPVDGLRKALLNFITGGVVRILQSTRAGKRPGKFSFLMHTEAGKQAHEWQTRVVRELVKHLKNAVSDSPALLDQLVSDAYTNLRPSIVAAGESLPDLATVLSRAREALVEEHITVATINSERDIDTLLDKSGQLRLDSPLNIFVGGQILDRGITIAGLIGFFYGRNPKRFQQDTVLQHSRMYGARPPADCAVTRFYTTPNIYAAMAEMHEMDEQLRRRIIKGGANQRFTFIELSATPTSNRFRLPSASGPCSSAGWSSTKPCPSHLPYVSPHAQISPSSLHRLCAQLLAYAAVLSYAHRHLISLPGCARIGRKHPVRHHAIFRNRSPKSMALAGRAAWMRPFFRELSQ